MENNSKDSFGVSAWLDAEMPDLYTIEGRMKEFMGVPDNVHLAKDTQIALCQITVSMYLAYQKDSHRWLDDKPMCF